MTEPGGTAEMYTEPYESRGGAPGDARYIPGALLHAIAERLRPACADWPADEVSVFVCRVAELRLKAGAPVGIPAVDEIPAAWRRRLGGLLGRATARRRTDAGPVLAR